MAGLDHDPLVHNKVTARLLRFLLDAGELARGRSPSSAARRCPCGWRRPLRLPAGSAALAAAAPPDVVRALEPPPDTTRSTTSPSRSRFLTRPAGGSTTAASGRCLCRGHRARAQDVRRRAGRAAPPARRRGGDRRPVARGAEEPEGACDAVGAQEVEGARCATSATPGTWAVESRAVRRHLAVVGT